MSQNPDAVMLSRALHCLHDAVALVDLENRVVYANPALEELVGAARDGLVGRGLEDLLDKGPEGSQPLSLAGRTVRQGALRHASGEAIPVRWSAILVSDTEAGVFSTFTFHDLRAEIQDEQMGARLRQAERLTLLGQVFGGVAHEIRNALGHVLLSAELLERRVDGGRDEALTARLRAATDRCQGMLNRVLGFVRVRPAERQRASLYDLVQELLDIVERPFALLGVRVTLEVEEGLAEPVVDRDKIQQVLINLLQNARDALVAARGGGRIWIRLANHEGGVVLRVSDDGPGVPPELLERVGEAFFTTKPEGQGTGLGLSICRTLVGEHGGTLDLRAAPEGGLEATVRLPLVPPEEAAAEDPGGAVRVSQAPGPRWDPLDGLAVLVVDDDPAWRAMLRQAFATLGAARIDAAADASQALELMEQRAYGLVVCDVRLPVVSGPKLLRIARRAFPDTARRFLFLTGFPDDEQLAQLAGPEGEERLGKPCDLASLHQAASRVLARSGPGGEPAGRGGPPPVL